MRYLRYFFAEKIVSKGAQRYYRDITFDAVALMFYWLDLQSKNKDYLILFPYFHSDRSAYAKITKNMVYSELKAALCLNVHDETLKLDTVKYIKTFTNKHTKNHFNADTVFICTYPLITPYKKIYNYCIGINVIKTGHPSAMMKIFLTEEGKAKEEEYMRLIFNSIHYPDVAPPIPNKKKFDKVRKRSKAKFMVTTHPI